MSKARVKKIKVPIGANDEGIAEMFNQMLGAGSINMTIAYPRYMRIKGICEQLVKLFSLLVDSPFMKAYKDFAPQKAQMENFCAEADKKMAEIFKMDFSDYEWNLTLVEDELQKKFASDYELMKKSDLINTFIVMCDRLMPYKKNFNDLDKLNSKFITTMPGAEWIPFPFTNLNLKYIFSLNIGKNTIGFFMIILHKSFELSHQLFEEIQSPDIDVDQFSDFIMKNIDEIQKRPELHRCKEAFNKIKESVGMLKNNFGGYYRDFISTNDSTIMMQHFILDVSKTDTSAKITRQFQVIINYYRKIAGDQIKNPKFKMLFDKISASFKELERGTENLVKIREDKLDDEITEESESDSDMISSVARTAEEVCNVQSTASNKTINEKK